MEKEFSVILDKDEIIEKAFKPNKKKVFASNVIITLFSCFWILIPCIIGVFVPDEEGFTLPPIAILIVGICILVIIAISLIFCAIYYKNTFYAYSNKRVIIKTGILGVDYKSLDLNMIGAFNVNVGLLDKLLRTNTGTITFGSPAMAGQNGALIYTLSSVNSPYELYKEIKENISDLKNGEKKVEQTSQSIE